MNSESTAKGPYEQDNRYLGDWLCQHERRHLERRMTGWTLLAFGLVVAALVFAANFGMVHPQIQKLAEFMGVR